MKLIVNGEVEKDISETSMRMTREATPDDMDKVAEYTEWLTQFPIDNILGLMCLQLDILDDTIEGFDAVEMSDVVAQAIKERHTIDRR